MKIIQIITRNELRGAEVFAATLSEALLARGHQVCLPAIYRCDNPAFELPGAEHVELGGRRKGKLEVRALANLRACLRSFQPDVIQANGFHALKYAVLAKRWSRSRSPIVYRNISLAGDWIRGGVRRAWGKWLFRNVAYVTSVSDQCAANLCQTYDYPTAQTSVIHRGIEIPSELDRHEARQALRREIGADHDGHLLLHTGGFTAEKNQSGLLDVFDRVRRDRGDVDMVFCGDGPLRSQVEQSAAELGFKQRVHFLGNRPDAAELAGGADLFVLASHVEGIPGVVLEAAARRTPSVCMGVGGIREAVLDGESGLVVPAGDNEAMAGAITRLLGDAPLRESMGNAARQHIEQQFALDRATDQFEQLYLQLV